MTHEVIVTMKSGQQIRGVLEVIQIDAGVSMLEMRGYNVAEVRMDDAYQPNAWPDFFVGMFVGFLITTALAVGAFYESKPVRQMEERPHQTSPWRPGIGEEQVPVPQPLEACVGWIPSSWR
jgi:hypothetical protein